MNPTYTEFRFPQIKAHPWSKARPSRGAMLLPTPCVTFLFSPRLGTLLSCPPLLSASAPAAAHAAAPAGADAASARLPRGRCFTSTCHRTL